jgi:transposase-like protein
LEGIFLWRKKDKHLNSYSVETKLKAVMMYENGEGSYQTLANQFGLKSSTQLKDWVEKHRNGR